MMWWIVAFLFLALLARNFFVTQKKYMQRQFALGELLSKIEIEERYQLASSNRHLQAQKGASPSKLSDFVEEAFVLIKSEINPIFDLINQSFLPNFSVFYQSSIFKGAILKIENLCHQKVKSRKELTQADLNQLQEAFKDCLRANFLESKIHKDL